MDKMVHKNEEKLVVTFQVSLLASSRNSLVRASSSKCRQLPEMLFAQSN